MNRVKILGWILCAALVAGLAGCASQPEPTDADRLPEQTEPRQVVTLPLPSLEGGESTEPTTLSVGADYQVRQMPEQIKLYPFTREELENAITQVEQLLDRLSQEAGALERRCGAFGGL